MKLLRPMLDWIRDWAEAAQDDPELSAWRDATGDYDGFPEWYDDGCYRPDTRWIFAAIVTLALITITLLTIYSRNAHV